MGVVVDVVVGVGVDLVVVVVLVDVVAGVGVFLRITGETPDFLN